MAKTKLFLDVEFTGLHKLTTLISIALVAEDGKKYYAEFTDFDKYQIDDFLRQHVLSKRTLAEYDFERDYDPNADLVLVKGDIDTVYATMLRWLEQYKEHGVEMWGDLLAYDWVLFISIFGNGLNLPKFIDYIPMDLCTALKLYGEDKDVNREVFAYGEEIAEANKGKKHNSLYDAETSLEVFKRLVEKTKPKEEESEDEGEEEESEAENENTTVEAYKEEAEEVIAKEEAEELEEVEEEEIEEEEEAEPPIKAVVEKEVEKKEPAKKKEAAKKPAAKKRGRPKKNSTEKKVDEKVVKEVPEKVELDEVTSDVNAPKVEFIEPTQEQINSSEEWNPPI